MTTTKDRLQARLIEERDGIAFWLTSAGNSAIYKDGNFVAIFTGKNHARSAWHLWDSLRADRNAGEA